ncbi:MAG: hypothetical protein JWO87_4004 [Phycisphaerales bacterium]|nr:hypothetical protein [Phycisphaerales bacterium]MDB5302341.1 hypothetical protein [Phycisphaerales bacterium]MDB5304883.1 hypothetical protein [Phycisphaerales bacterium]
MMRWELTGGDVTRASRLRERLAVLKNSELS